MITVLWLSYAVLVAGLVTLAAWLLSRVTTRSGRQSRGVWVGAAALTMSLPLVALGAPPEPASPVFSLGPAWEWPVGPAVLTGSPAVVPPEGSLASFDVEQVLLTGWLLASVAVALWVALSYRSLARQRRHWHIDQVQGTPVLVAPDFGPAVVGVLRPAVVVPAWFRGLPEESQVLAMSHERQHLEAHDSRLLALLLGCVVLMPWQPFLWMQLAALRGSIEFDCDRRVLGRFSASGRYAALLLTLAERARPTGWALPLVALWSTPSRLARRVQLICDSPRVGRGELGMAMSGAALALLLACSTNAPTPAAVPPRATAVPGGSTPARTTAQDEQLAWERRLAENFAAPSEHHSFEQRPVYWILTDTAGVVVRHDTGGRELLFRDERYWRTYLPDDYRRARARADAAGRRGPLGGFFRLGSGQVYQHFPEVREMDLVSYGLMPAAFGADTVMLAFGMVRPASRE